MQRIKLYSLALVAIIWFMIIIPYFLAQTSFGANLVAQYISGHSAYNVTISHISHSFGNPYEIRLHDIIVTDKNNETQYLQAETLTLATHNQSPFTFNDLNYIIIQHGHLNLTHQPKTDEIVQAKLLQLLDVSMDINTEKPITINNIQGGIQPWSSKNLTDKSLPFQFNFTAQALKYDDIDMQSLVLSGFQKNNTLFLNNMGGNIEDGFFIGKAKRLPNDDWIIDNLQINHLNLQTERKLRDLQAITPPLSKFTINYFALTNSSLESPDLNIEKSNVEINNIHYDKQWNIQNITLLFNADHVVWQNEDIIAPTVKISANNNHVVIEKSAGHWRNGLFNLNGTWANNNLILNNVFLSGIDYPLPENWQKTLQNMRLPSYLSNVSVKKLTVMPSTIIDTHADFPMQYTFFEARGHNLQLAKQQQWALSQGKLTLKAQHATINTITLKHTDLNITANNNALSMELSALTETGLLEANAELSVAEHKINDLNIIGYSVDPALLSQWKVLKTPIADHSFILQLAGKFSPLQLDGQLTLKRFTGDLTSPIKNNHIILN